MHLYQLVAVMPVYNEVGYFHKWLARMISTLAVSNPRVKLRLLPITCLNDISHHTEGTMAAPTETFRFLDLPVELRNKVYCELLCSFTFEEEPTGRPFSTLDRIMDQGMFSINEARTTSDTSILLVSRAIHREAYDIMVKSNQFIRIRGRDFNWSEILPQSKLPVVTMDRQRVAQFRGYVLCMTVEEDILDSEDEDRPPAVFDCELPQVRASLRTIGTWKYAQNTE